MIYLFKDIYLKKGMRTDDVFDLQYHLYLLSFDPKGIDGIFGDNTHNAVIALQKAAKLPIAAETLGIVGTQTKAIIAKTLRDKGIDPATAFAPADVRDTTADAGPPPTDQEKVADNDKTTIWLMAAALLLIIGKSLREN